MNEILNIIKEKDIKVYDQFGEIKKLNNLTTRYFNCPALLFTILRCSNLTLFEKEIIYYLIEKINCFTDFDNSKNGERKAKIYLKINKEKFYNDLEFLFNKTRKYIISIIDKLIEKEIIKFIDNKLALNLNIINWSKKKLWNEKLLIRELVSGQNSELVKQIIRLYSKNTKNIYNFNNIELVVKILDISDYYKKCEKVSQDKIKYEKLSQNREKLSQKWEKVSQKWEKVSQKWEKVSQYNHCNIIKDKNNNIYINNNHPSHPNSNFESEVSLPHQNHQVDCFQQSPDEYNYKLGDKSLNSFNNKNNINSLGDKNTLGDLVGNNQKKIEKVSVNNQSSSLGDLVGNNQKTIGDISSSDKIKAKKFPMNNLARLKNHEETKENSYLDDYLEKKEKIKNQRKEKIWCLKNTPSELDEFKKFYDKYLEDYDDIDYLGFFIFYYKKFYKHEIFIFKEKVKKQDLVKKLVKIKENFKDKYDFIRYLLWVLIFMHPQSDSIWTQGFDFKKAIFDSTNKVKMFLLKEYQNNKKILWRNDDSSKLRKVIKILRETNNIEVLKEYKLDYGKHIFLMDFLLF